MARYLETSVGVGETWQLGPFKSTIVESSRGRVRIRTEVPDEALAMGLDIDLDNAGRIASLKKSLTPGAPVV